MADAGHASGGDSAGGIFYFQKKLEFCQDSVIMGVQDVGVEYGQRLYRHLEPGKDGPYRGAEKRWPEGTGRPLRERKEEEKASIVAEQILAFEKEAFELQELARAAGFEEDRVELQAQFEAAVQRAYADLTPWQRVQIARHPRRPRMLDYVYRIFDDFVELHGGRGQGDDPAMVCGIARFHGQTLFVAGQQKGVTTDEKVARNFGMAHPSGYRKALRIFETAERLGYPVVTFVDTPAAHPGIEAEKEGQGPAIARNLLACAGLKTPIFTVILGEGGSGGALGIAMGDWICMFEYALYMICPPERCAEILWRDVGQKEAAAAAMKMTARDLQAFGVIDRILAERPGAGAAHLEPDAAAKALEKELGWFLAEQRAGRWTPEKRQERFQAMGAWVEAAETPAARSRILNFRTDQ
jgi:acetyl-CoA carboxylase carboxyl transferase subunit alpha